MGLVNSLIDQRRYEKVMFVADRMEPSSGNEPCRLSLPPRRYLLLFLVKRRLPNGARWISCANRIQQESSNEDNDDPLIYAAEGFVRGLLIYQPAAPYDKGFIDVDCSVRPS